MCSCLTSSSNTDINRLPSVIIDMPNRSSFSPISSPAGRTQNSDTPSPTGDGDHKEPIDLVRSITADVLGELQRRMPNIYQAPEERGCWENLRWALSKNKVVVYFVQGAVTVGLGVAVRALFG